MDRQDYSNIIKSHTLYRNVNPLAPQWPFRLYTVGPSGCGKTNEIVNLILNHLDFDKLYVLAGDTQEDLYQYLLCAMEERGIPTCVTNEIENIPALDQMDKTKQNLVLIDDFVTQEFPLFDELWMRGRKKNVSSIYISQSYFKGPKMVRLNSNYFMLFDVSDKKQIRQIVDSHSCKTSFDDFMDMYREIHKVPYNFMLIDKHTDIPKLTIRKNWDCLMI